MSHSLAPSESFRVPFLASRARGRLVAGGIHSTSKPLTAMHFGAIHHGLLGKPHHTRLLSHNNAVGIEGDHHPERSPEHLELPRRCLDELTSVLNAHGTKLRDVTGQSGAVINSFAECRGTGARHALHGKSTGC